MMRTHGRRTLAASVAAACGLAAGLASGASAGPVDFTISVLVRDGDSYPFGLVTSVDNMAVNDLGSWIAEADTDFPDTNFDGLLIKDGALLIREGDALTDPAGASIDSFDSITLNNSGRSGWNFFLDGTSGLSDDSGIFVDTGLVFQEGTVSGAPQFTPGTAYIGFFETKYNNSNQMFVLASIEDVNIPTTVDRALVILDVDPDTLDYTETVVGKEGDALAGVPDAIADFATGPHGHAFNDSGSLVYVADTVGATTEDIYIAVANAPYGAKDHVLVAQEGRPSGIDARNWLTLGTSTKVDINSSGAIVHTGALDGDTTNNTVIVKYDSAGGATQIVAQEGDAPPGIAGEFLLTAFGSGPVYIDDDGNVLWFGDWNDADTTRDTGLFLNDQLLLQEGVTVVDGQTVTVLRGIEAGYFMSRNGKYILARVQFTGAVDALLLIEIDQGGKPCPADCDGNGVVNAADVGCFLSLYFEDIANETTIADCDGNGVTNAADVGCFQNLYFETLGDCP